MDNANRQPPKAEGQLSQRVVGELKQRLERQRQQKNSEQPPQQLQQQQQPQQQQAAGSPSRAPYHPELPQVSPQPLPQVRPFPSAHQLHRLSKQPQPQPQQSQPQPQPQPQQSQPQQSQVQLLSRPSDQPATALGAGPTAAAAAAAAATQSAGRMELPLSSQSPSSSPLQQIGPSTMSPLPPLSSSPSSRPQSQLLSAEELLRQQRELMQRQMQDAIMAVNQEAQTRQQQQHSLFQQDMQRQMQQMREQQQQLQQSFLQQQQQMHVQTQNLMQQQLLQQQLSQAREREQARATLQQRLLLQQQDKSVFLDEHELLAERLQRQEEEDRDKTRLQLQQQHALMRQQHEQRDAQVVQQHLALVQQRDRRLIAAMQQQGPDAFLRPPSTSSPTPPPPPQASGCDQLAQPSMAESFRQQTPSGEGLAWPSPPADELIQQHVLQEQLRRQQMQQQQQQQQVGFVRAAPQSQPRSYAGDGMRASPTARGLSPGPGLSRSASIAGPPSPSFRSGLGATGATAYFSGGSQYPSPALLPSTAAAAAAPRCASSTSGTASPCFGRGAASPRLDGAHSAAAADQGGHCCGRPGNLSPHSHQFCHCAGPRRYSSGGGCPGSPPALRHVLSQHQPQGWPQPQPQRQAHPKMDVKLPAPTVDDSPPPAYSSDKIPPAISLDDIRALVAEVVKESVKGLQQPLQPPLQPQQPQLQPQQPRLQPQQLQPQQSAQAGEDRHRLEPDEETVDAEFEPAAEPVPENDEV